MDGTMGRVIETQLVGATGLASMTASGAPLSGTCQRPQAAKQVDVQTPV